MDKWLGVAAAALIAAVILILTEVRRARITKHCDGFAMALCELYDSRSALLSGGLLGFDVENGFALKHVEEQPEDIQRLLTAGADDKTREACARMKAEYDEAKKELTVVNLLTKRYAPVLDRCYELGMLFELALEDVRILSSEKAAEAFNYFLNEQKYIRTVTLAQIVSAGRAEELKKYS